jgi:hypothetical protein
MMGLVGKALQAIKDIEKVSKVPEKVIVKKSQISRNKKLDFETEEDRIANECGWVIGIPGELYEIMINRFSSVFIMMNDEKRFDVVRLTWRKGEASPFIEKFRAKNVSFNKALEIGNKYISWLKKNL